LQVPNPDKPEPKGISRKAAKDAKEIFKFWFFNPNDLLFFASLATRLEVPTVGCAKYSCHFERDLIP
jgi:hypothetical protein